MRIAGGVVLLIIGLWSLIGGACTAFVGGAGTAAMSAGSSALGKADTSKLSGKQKAQLDKALGDLKKAGAKAKSATSGALIGGIITLVAGILCIIAGIMFFLNKGKMLGFIAAGVGILGEVVFIIMVGFFFTLVIKIVLYAFGGFAATKVGTSA